VTSSAAWRRKQTRWAALLNSWRAGEHSTAFTHDMDTVKTKS